MEDHRTGNYTAFYVSEPFDSSNLGANATKDFCYYRAITAWEAKDPDFHFIDSHEKTYNVRDESSWEDTLKPRLHSRLRLSKNIILILSSNTKYSKALREEIDYGINTLGLPVIVIYPDFSEKNDIIDENKQFKLQVKKLWDKLPVFRDNMNKVATIHIPFKQALLKKCLDDPDLTIQKMKIGRYFF
ncbi:MAG: hypothetical protein IJ905_03720 [Fibrobacter sp.]|nr:hypothetical protein [Fibrobacter sp.]MBR6123965.1 hypothetical protein [Candidatus Saccharibacteria bacterium]